MTSKCLTKIWAAFLLAFVQVVGCGEYSTEQILNGAFIDKERIDSTPPNRLSPPNDFRVIANPDGTMTVALVWSDKFQADYYLLEIAEDSQFDNLVEVVEIKGQSGAPPENTYQFETNQALTYYWRVRANTTGVQQSLEVGRFHALDAVYVFCPAQLAECDSAQAYGTRSHPYVSIQEGIDQAVVDNLPVLVAQRDDSNTAYNEAITFSNGAQVYGGYEPTTWELVGRTALEYAGLVVVSIGYNS